MKKINLTIFSTCQNLAKICKTVMLRQILMFPHVSFIKLVMSMSMLHLFNTVKSKLHVSGK